MARDTKCLGELWRELNKDLGSGFDSIKTEKTLEMWSIIRPLKSGEKHASLAAKNSLEHALHITFFYFFLKTFKDLLGCVDGLIRIG